jgi:hypothetical protein
MTPAGQKEEIKRMSMKVTAEVTTLEGAFQQFIE